MSGYIFKNRVELTDWESSLGVRAGSEMRRRSRRDGRVPRGTTKKFDGYEIQILGALGEIAFCKWANIFWFPRFTAERKDYGNVQIRTVSSHTYNLILDDDDSPDDIFVLVSTDDSDTVFDIVGWAMGSEVKQEKFRNQKDSISKNAFVFPRELLHPMNAIPVDLRKVQG